MHLEARSIGNKLSKLDFRTKKKEWKRLKYDILMGHGNVSRKRVVMVYAE